MVKVFLDTDVCLDNLANRAPFSERIYHLLSYAESQSIQVFISELCIPNLIYILSEKYKLENSSVRLIRWLQTCQVISSDRALIIKALQSPFKDKEDACQYYTAIHNDMDYFITRNKKDYQKFTTTLPVYTPSEFLKLKGTNDLK